MVVRRSASGTVRFAIRPRGAARDVRLAGSFSNWQPVRMRRERGNLFAASIPLPAGTFDYKFIIDGRWELDPGQDCRSINPYGTVHSTVRVT